MTELRVEPVLFSERLRETSERRRKALITGGAIIQNSTKSNDAYLKTIFLIHGRAIDTFIVPLVLVTINAIVWTILIKFPFKGSFIVDEEPWASTYTLVLTTTLAFLLVFRLNRVAIRWWDTRSMWGSVIAHSRLLVGAIAEHCNHEPECRDAAIAWVAAHAIALKEHMRDDDGHFEYEEIVGFLSPDQINCVASSNHPCIYAATEIRHALKKAFTVSADTPAALGASYSSEMRLMEKSLDILQKDMGGLERVRSTPLSIIFVTHQRTFMMLYLFSLPYLYGHAWGYGTIPSVFLISYALLGIDGSASECESPFKKRPNHLNMERFCLIIMEDIEQIVSHNHDLQQKRIFA